MRPFSVLTALVVLVLSESAVASQRFLPMANPKPLGVLVQEAKTIHVFKVESVGPNGASRERDRAHPMLAKARRRGYLFLFWTKRLRRGRAVYSGCTGFEGQI